MSKKPVELSPTDIKDIVDSRPMKDALGLMSRKYGIGTGRVRSIWAKAYGGADLKSYAAWAKNKTATPADTPAVTQETQVSQQVTPIKQQDGPRTAEVGGTVLKAKAPKVVTGRSKPSVVRKQKVEQIDMDVAQIEAGNNSGDLIAAVKSAAGMARGSQKLTKAALRQAETANMLAHKMIDMRQPEDIEYSISDEDDEPSSCSVGPRRITTGSNRRSLPQNIQVLQKGQQVHSSQPYNNLGRLDACPDSSEECLYSDSESESPEPRRKASIKADRPRGSARARPSYRTAVDARSEERTANRPTAVGRQSIRDTRLQREDEEQILRRPPGSRETDRGGRGRRAEGSGGLRGEARPSPQEAKNGFLMSFKRPL